MKRLACLSISLFFLACGNDATVAVPDGGVPDAGSNDAGVHDAGAPDAGTDAGTPDAGANDEGSSDAGPLDGGASDAGSSDAGSMDAGPSDGGLTAVTPNLGDRRGPVLLFFTFPASSGSATFTLEHAESGAFAAATTRSITQQGSSVLAVWDSFADLPSNVASTARLTATTGGVAQQASVSVSLKNDPETDRLILVGHSLLEDSTGAATMTGTTVSVIDWSGSAKAQQGSIATVTVGQGPQDLRASPNGRSAAVIEETSGNTTLLATPLSAATAGVHVLTTLTPPQGASTADARWSPDGRYLYLVSNSPNLLLRYEPTEDLTSVAAPTTLATLPGPPSRFDVDPVSGDLLVVCGEGASDNTSKVVLYQPDGTEAARLTEQLDAANDLRISPAGGLALMASDFSSDQVRLFAFTASAVTEVITPVATIPSPNEIVFYPSASSAGGAALISGPDSNRVTPLAFTATSVTGGTPLNVSLGSEVDLIERGTQTGSVFVTSVSSTTDVSSVQRVQLTSSGAATVTGTACSFGTSTAALPQGIAVQR